ncbi:MAG: hypothetical protein ACFFDN_27110, partial [Candidatus Hodarchaeota archaeon]
MIPFFITPQDELFRELALGFTFLLIGVKFYLSFFYMRKYFSSEIKNKLILGFALFFLFLGLGRVFYLFFDFYLTNFNPNLFQTHILIWKIASLLSEIGVGFLIIIAEKKVFEGKDMYIFFICYSVFVALMVAWPEFERAEDFGSYAVMFGAFILFSYIYLAVILEGEARIRAILVFIGLFFYIAGAVIVNEYVLKILEVWGISRFIMHLISPILKIF